MTALERAAQGPTVGVVVPCYRQERYLERTTRAVEVALASHAWRGVIVRSASTPEPMPALGPAWQVVAPPVTRPLTPGAARMLGFSSAGGEWVLFVDADIEVQAPWMEAALAAAADDPGLGGLGGRIEEWFETAGGERPGSDDMHRVGRADRAVEYLAAIALYRREALVAAGGYDARLNSEEDFELGLRFAAAGFPLRSFGLLAARHWSGPRPSFGEIARRWRAGLCYGMGQVLRLYLGRPGFGRLLARQWLYLATLAMWAWGAAALAALLAGGATRPLLVWINLPLLVLAAMTMRKRSLRLALHSLLTWTVNGLGMVVGFVQAPPHIGRASEATR